MLDLLKASFGVLLMRIPGRSFLKRTSLVDTLALSIAIAIPGILLAYALALADSQESMFTSVWIISLSNIGIFLLMLFINWVMINRYAKERFSFKEVIVLNVLIGSGVSVFYLVLDFGYLFLDEYITAPLWILEVGISLYLLYLSMLTISKMASITRSQAITVVLGPLLVVIVAWFVFIMLTIGLAAILS